MLPGEANLELMVRQAHHERLFPSENGLSRTRLTCNKAQATHAIPIPRGHEAERIRSRVFQAGSNGASAWPLPDAVVS